MHHRNGGLYSIGASNAYSTPFQQQRLETYTAHKRSAGRCVLLAGSRAGAFASDVPGTGTAPVKKAVPQPAPVKRPSPKQPAKRPEPKLEDVDLTTRDGVLLSCTYYPGPESKETAPIILIHDWDESRGELDQLARFMQQGLKMSVIVPDLRGHGASRQQRGMNRDLDPSKFNRNEIYSMIGDIEACKSFLLKRNNEEEVNIEQLAVMGTGFGATLAVQWAIQDWSVRNLPTYKQGQDVKLLILVSPRWSNRGSTLQRELKLGNILRNISTMIIVGQGDSSKYRDAKRIHTFFEKAWGDQAKEAAPLFLAKTSLQATDLAKSRGTGVDRAIATFLLRRLLERGEQYPWTDRTSPLK